jgi:ribosomal protein L35AE/L33A
MSTLKVPDNQRAAKSREAGASSRRAAGVYRYKTGCGVHPEDINGLANRPHGAQGAPLRRFFTEQLEPSHFDKIVKARGLTGEDRVNEFRRIEAGSVRFMRIVR